MNKTTQPTSRSINRFILGALFMLSLFATGYQCILLNEQQQQQSQEQHNNQQQHQFNVLIRQHAEQAIQGDTAAFTSLRQVREDYATQINQTNSSATQTSQWLALRTEIEQILLAQAAIQSNRDNHLHTTELLNQLQPLTIQLVRELTQANAPSRQILSAIDQLNIVQTIYQANHSTINDTLAEQRAQLTRLQSAFKNNINDTQAAQTQQAIATLLTSLDKALSTLNADQPARLRAEQAYQALDQSLQDLSQNTQHQPIQLGQIHLSGYSPQQILYGLAGITLILMVFWMISSSQNSRRQAQYAHQQHKQNHYQQQTLQKLAEGDLTIDEQAPEVLSQVVKDVQQLVRKIQTIHLHITNCSHETQDSRLRLQETAEHQQDQTEQTINQNQTLIQQLQKLTATAEQAENQGQALYDSLTQIVNTQHQDYLNSLQHSQNTATEHVQQAETTAEQIQDQMRLIEELADQSNILALNAAMQAALAGEAGRAFTVVSNEVQRLAQQANHSTRQIGGLLDTIHHHHQASLDQLQHGTTQVSEGTNITNIISEQIQQLKTASQQHTEQLLQLTQQAQQQTQEASLINDNLHIIHHIGQQTSESATQTADAVTALSTQADPLNAVIEKYQIPSQPKEQPPTLSAI